MIDRLLDTTIEKISENNSVLENTENSSEELMLDSIEYNVNMTEEEIPEAVASEKISAEDYQVYLECCKRG